MSESGNSDLERELYYLVTKFLENGPCKEAGEVLRRQLNENKLLIIPRKDWTGNSHERTFDEYDGLNGHIHQDHLLKLTSRLNFLVGSSFPHAIKSVSSLLSRGSLSLLRDEELSRKSPDSNLLSRHAASFHSAPYLFSSRSNIKSVCSMIVGQGYSGVKTRANITRSSDIYSKISMHKRILGHLASVYCVLFDETGSVIVTGADDKLLKMWSAKDGRLVATFRGHAGQITDIAINKENTFIASGSLDKTIRVWKLHNTYPVAVLQGHSGMITCLKFCPTSHFETRYLVSTGGDAHVCFWPWNPVNEEFSLTPTRFNEKSRAGAQMLCLSFSPGGSFLTTGSSDNYIRVYQLYPEPEKIAELPNHTDHVDSIVYSNFGSRFLSGSRDGTAMIWSFVSGEWQTTCLDCSQSLKSDNRPFSEESKSKLKVTMICWSANDKYIITAGTDFILRVWDSYTATFLNSLKGHTEDIYILETHPTEEHFLLSAGHDGNLILWDLEKFTQIKLFFNMLEGQGHGAIFDCKFSPTGLQFAATDSHGHLLIFGLGSDDRFRRVPYEQFYHTDYREIVRDSQNYVLDTQLQTAPHLMPPPYLVDIDGNPYPSHFQMLIPGRTQRNLPQLRMEQQQMENNLPPLLAEIAAAEAAERNETLRSPGPSRRQSVAVDGLLSPGGGVGLRESGNVEGVRQENNQYVSGDITDADAEAWRNRTIIPPNTLYNQSERDRNRLQCSIDELSNYILEKNKQNRKNSESKNDDRPYLRSARGRGRGRGRGGRTRQAKSQEQVVFVRESALRQLDYLQPYDAGREMINVEMSSESEAEDWQGESSDSTDDSDWVNEATVVREVSARTKRKRQKRGSPALTTTNDDNDSEDVDTVGKDQESSEEITSSSEEEVVVSRTTNDDDDGDGDKNSGDDDDERSSSSVEKKQQRRSRRKKVTSKRKKTRGSPPPQPVRKKSMKKVKKEIKTKKPLPSVDNVEEYLAAYAPPEWLLNVEPKKFPYFPQIGDEVYYLRQGHHLYVEEVIKQNEYDIVETKQAYRRYDLASAELCTLVGISYDIGPPKMCSLKLELHSKRRATGNRRTITVRFHDMPNVVDFLVLKHIYEDSLQQNWSDDDRFRCIIDDTWYFGTILQVSPFQEEFLTSSFLSLIVKWDTGDEERVSPWDLERIPTGIEEKEAAIDEDDKKLFKYTPTDRDWPNEGMDVLRKRAVEALEAFVELEIAWPFAYPVNVTLYPTYWGTIAFPTDLETIRKRICHGFYRRRESLLWEVRQLKTNAEKFNEEGSGIVSDAYHLVKILCRFLKNPECNDIIGLYTEVTNTEQAKESRDHDTDDEKEMEEENDGMDVQCGSSGGQGGSSGGSSSLQQDWMNEAKSLLDFLSSKDDAQPFLEPVDTEQFLDYSTIITEPMDISTIRHRLENNQYDNVEAYIRDFQLMFDNSKIYNTDRRSEIYKMTLRLSALFKDRCEGVRAAYRLQAAIKTVHMTRRKTKTLIKPKDNDVEPSADIGSHSRATTRTVNNKTSPSRVVLNRITLADYTRRPTTRSRRRSSSCDVPTSLGNDQPNPGNDETRHKRRTNTRERSRSSSPEEPTILCKERSRDQKYIKDYESLKQVAKKIPKRSSSCEPQIPIFKARKKQRMRQQESGGSSDSSEFSSEEEEEEKKQNSENEKELNKKKLSRNSRKVKVSHKEHSPPSRRTSCRVSVKRIRYGFESGDDDDEEEMKPQQPASKKKKMKNGKAKKVEKKNTTKVNNISNKKPLTNGNAGSSSSSRRRTARSKVAVSYCENDNYEVFEDDSFEPEIDENHHQPQQNNKKIPSSSSSTSSNSNSSSDGGDEDGSSASDSSSSEEDKEEKVPVTGISSRGRLRRVATRFLDYT